jgi:hypothetical protein
LNVRNFASIKNADQVLIEEGCWNNLNNKPEYQKRLEENKISYHWDKMIDRAHEGGSEYELVARELARPNRFQRRILTKIFFDGQGKAHRDNISNTFRRKISFDGVTYCFLYMDDPDPRKNRKNMLSAMCWIARGLDHSNSKVIGIATEKIIRQLTSFDFCLLHIPEWTEEYQTHIEQLQQDTGIFTDSGVTRFTEDEY